jgi:hypothetical protein
MKTTKHNPGNNLMIGKKQFFDYEKIKEHKSHLLRLRNMKGLVLDNNPAPKTFDHLLNGTKHVPT